MQQQFSQAGHAGSGPAQPHRPESHIKLPELCPLLTIAASVSLSLQVRQNFVDFNLSYVSLLFFAIFEGNKDLQFCFSPVSVLL